MQSNEGAPRGSDGFGKLLFGVLCTVHCNLFVQYIGADDQSISRKWYSSTMCWRDLNILNSLDTLNQENTAQLQDIIGLPYIISPLHHYFAMSKKSFVRIESAARREASEQLPRASILSDRGLGHLSHSGRVRDVASDQAL